MQNQQLLCSKRQRCKCATFIVAKFHFEYIRRKFFDNRANLSVPEFALRLATALVGDFSVVAWARAESKLLTPKAIRMAATSKSP
jgi:hypothetical protein